MIVLVWIALLGSLALLSWGAGGAFTRALCPAAVLLAVTLGAFRWSRYRRGDAPASSGWGLDLMLVILLGFLTVNVIPMPLGLSRITGPGRYQQNLRVTQALERGDALGLENDSAHGGYALTRNRAGSLRVTVLVIAAACAGLLTAYLGSRGRYALMACLVLLGMGLGVAGIVSLRFIPQGDTVWWRIPIEHGLPGPVACFYNRNHFAGYLAMLCPVALAFALCKGTIRWWLRVPFGLAAFAVMSAAIVATHSRGGLLAYGAGLLATSVLLLARRRVVAGGVVLLLIVACTAMVATTPLPLLKARLSALRDPASEGSVQTRLTAWRDTVRICRTYPVLGAGPNAFRMVYPQHRTTSRSGFMTHAENEYVQTVAEFGLIGTLLVSGMAVALLRAMRKAPTASRDAGAALWICAWAALFAAGVHASVEFALHTPLVTVTLAMLTGFLLPAADRTEEGLGRSRRLLCLPCIAIPLAVTLAFFSHSMQRLDALSFFDDAGTRNLERSLKWAPTSWQAWYHYGRKACLLRTWEGARFGEQCITQAVAYDPNNYRILRELGKLRLSLGDAQGARRAFDRVKELRWWVPVPEVPE